MIIVKGKVINKVERKPYVDNNKNEVPQMDVDVKDNEERYFNTVSGEPKDFKDISVGDEVEIAVRQFHGISKSNASYLINRFVGYVADEEVTGDKS